MMNNNFLDREGLEKANLESKFLLGGFFGLNFLRKGRVATLRAKAAKLTNCPQDHQDNGDEKDFQNVGFVGSFTKGLPHNCETGQVLDSEQFKRFRVAIHTGDFFNQQQPDLGRADFDWRAVNIPDANSEKPVRGWESPASGLTFEMHGPDSHSVTMPPAPKLGTDELTLEMAEVYWLALLRDVEFKHFQTGSDCEILNNAIAHLNALPSQGEGIRKRRLNSGDQLDAQYVFRGATDGDVIGPYLSQFLLIGTPGHENNTANVTNGLIGYGALKIDQKLVPAQLGLDHMTTWDVFLDVQDAANIRGTDKFSPPDSTSFLEPRFITYPRDLATYVHFDALYEAYLNACLILLGFQAPADPGISQLNDIFSKRAKELSAGDFGRVDGFALFGAAHILNLVTEVSTRALKAVRYQKFNIHCRLRPEALAGWMEAIRKDTDIKEIEQLAKMYDDLNQTLGGVNLFEELKTYNSQQNTQDKFNERPYIKPESIDQNLNQETVLLPMAFPEGSPMHPAYGAGHATVAGACVTILKAFFDTSALFVKRDGKLMIVPASQKQDSDEMIAYVPVLDETTQQSSLSDNEFTLSEFLTVGNELDKLAANISIGRNMAGVHYYSDYIDSLVMGEKIALGVLLEQSLAYEIYPEEVIPSFSLTAFLKDDMGEKRQIKIAQGKITVNDEELEWCDL